MYDTTTKLGYLISLYPGNIVPVPARIQIKCNLQGQLQYYLILGTDSVVFPSLLHEKYYLTCGLPGNDWT